MLTGTVFSIDRCSFRDGPGIRTTVFLKGCPLDCKWCHNPESKKARPQLWYGEDKCISCMSCVAVCPTGAHTNIKAQHVLNRDKCILCGECVEVCPIHTLMIKGESMSVDKVMDIVKKDVSFYQSSGGGITVTGGEPLMQMAFTKELLKDCKAEGIHTCVETSGFGNSEKLLELNKYVDLYLFDYKLSNEADHIKYTGVSNKLILKNLDMLMKNGAKAIMRCPIIPTVNDHIEHFEHIARVARKYSGIMAVELMAYHNMGLSKATKVGDNITFDTTIETVDEDRKRKWLEIVKSYGCDNVKIG